MLQIVPFNFNDLPLGITVIFLNKILLHTSNFSSLYMSWNNFGNYTAFNLFATPWHGTLLFRNSLLQVVQAQLLSSYDFSMEIIFTSTLHFPILKQITDVLYRQRLHLTQIKNAPFFISFLKKETFLSKDDSYSLLLLTYLAHFNRSRVLWWVCHLGIGSFTSLFFNIFILLCCPEPLKLVWHSFCYLLISAEYSRSCASLAVLTCCD